jgi:hypothetical protein
MRMIHFKTKIEALHPFGILGHFSLKAKNGGEAGIRTLGEAL